MWLPLIGIVIGIILGMTLPFNIPTAYSSYMSIAVLAALDVFISGFFGNAILAAVLAYIGDRLDVPIYLCAIFVFGYRLFNNFALIRRHFLGILRKKSYLEESTDK
jgi:small basic protein